MSACNERPPEGHPFHGSFVACHLAREHVEVGIPHAWETAPWARGVLMLIGLFPEREVMGIDWQLPERLEVWECDEDGERVGERPYRIWSAGVDGPWVLLRFTDGEQWAIWKATGSVYRVGPDGAVEEDALNEESNRQRIARLLREVEAERPTFTCPRCGMTSAHPKDVEEGYCGNCHDWTRPAG